jgi:single-strand DNA-binding protein
METDMLPQITASGTLVADPEIRFTPAGHSVANFRMACNDRKLENGQWVDGEATFLRVTVWRTMAENLVESMVKGDYVVVTGRLKQNNWTDQQGQQRSNLEIEADEVAVGLRFRSAKPAPRDGSQYQPGVLQEPPAAPEQSTQMPW